MIDDNSTTMPVPKVGILSNWQREPGLNGFEDFHEDSIWFKQRELYDCYLCSCWREFSAA
jgi:hypothetical protein